MPTDENFFLFAKMEETRAWPAPIEKSKGGAISVSHEPHK